jgi:hypothetical protein
MLTVNQCEIQGQKMDKLFCRKKRNPETTLIGNVGMFSNVLMLGIRLTSPLQN